MKYSLAVLAALAVSSCSSILEQTRPNSASPRLDADSTTLALWHLDESHGEIVADAGPHGLDGWAGEGATVVPGFSGRARRFDGDPHSYVVVSWNPALKGIRSFTVEAMIRIADVATGGLQTIAAQWTSEVRHSSWYFGVVGSQTLLDHEIARGARIADASPYSLVFAYVSWQPGDSEDKVRVAISEKRVVPGAWSHVAVTFDAGRVRFYRDHVPDLDAGQEALARQAESLKHIERVRTTDAQLTIGGFFDSYLPPAASVFVVSRGVAFSGEIDEVRISNGVRSDLVVPVGKPNTR